MTNPWQQWLLEAEARQASLAPAPVPTSRAARKLVPHRSLTEEERSKIERLYFVHFAWWCADEHFVEKLYKSKDILITERQAWFILCLWYKYRVQLRVDPIRPPGYRR